MTIKTIKIVFIFIQVVPAFPYIIAFSSDTIEVRSTINCNLLQILNLPRLSLIAMKDDIYFTTTKMVSFCRDTNPFIWRKRIPCSLAHFLHTRHVREKPRSCLFFSYLDLILSII